MIPFIYLAHKVNSTLCMELAVKVTRSSGILKFDVKSNNICKYLGFDQNSIGAKNLILLFPDTDQCILLLINSDLLDNYSPQLCAKKDNSYRNGKKWQITSLDPQKYNILQCIISFIEPCEHFSIQFLMNTVIK